MVRSARASYLSRADLIERLMSAEQEFWSRGSVDGHRRRRDALADALAGGYTYVWLANALGVDPADIETWLRK